MNEQRNLVLAIALSVAIMLGFNHFYESPKREQLQTAQGIKAPGEIMAAGSVVSSAVSTPTVSSAPVSLPSTPLTREEALAQGQNRISIKSSKLQGSFNLEGGRLDDISLLDYKETPEPGSPVVTILRPSQTQDSYYADFGWVSSSAEVALPTSQTKWASSSTQLTPTSPVTLTWDNGQGVVFERIISLDENYMFTIVDRIHNKTAKSITLNAYSQINRIDTPKTGGFMILHEGPVGVLKGKLQEFDYSKLQDKKIISEDSTGGWLGITDKYWLVALVPPSTEKIHTRFKHLVAQERNVYQTELVYPSHVVEEGKTLEVQQKLFVGAKKLELLDLYEKEFNIKNFDLALDFGWFYFLTKPLFYVMEYLNKILGNFGLAILVLTIFVKLLFFPLANKSYRSMSKMKKVQPKIEALKKRYENDKIRMNQELMGLYKKEKINPVSGCLPMLIQAPVFFCLYKVLFVSIEMRHAPFFGWIHDLSAPDPTSIFNLFGLLPFAVPAFLMIGAWPLIMGATMIIQQRLNPQPADPIQAKMFMLMPIFFTFLLASFPAGLVIYWAWNNILSMIQQYTIMRLESTPQ